MKLTKGKLSKLFHKKKQTMRRYKNQRKYRRSSKTFRQRKPLNLHRSSMKKFVDPRKIEWIGGTDPEEKVPLVVKPASDETPTQDKISTFTLGSDETPLSTPATESTTEPVPSTEFVSETLSTPESVPEYAPALEPALEPAVEPAPEPVTATEQAPASEPLSAPETNTKPTTESVSEPETNTKPTTESVSEPETTQDDAIPTADALPKQIDAENVKPESSAVVDALDIIANKIAKAVVKEMRETPVMGSSPNQDADIAVPLAVDALVKQTQLAPE